VNERETVDEIIEQENVWSKGSMVLYHVTPDVNEMPIMAFGIRPDLCKGKTQSSWYVSKQGIIWAIAHVSLRHNVTPHNIVVMACMLPVSALKATGIRYAWRTTQRFQPEYAIPAAFFIYSEGMRNE
jgi:hypothetical protein